MNACLLTSAWSAASSDMYTSSRALYGLAIAGNAPKFFSKTLKNGLPWPALVVSALFALLSFMGVSTGAGKVFGWFSNMTSIAGLMTWFGIGVTYLRFYAGMKAQGINRDKLPYRSPLQPYLGWYTVCSTMVVCFVSPSLSAEMKTGPYLTSARSSPALRSSSRMSGLPRTSSPTTFLSHSSPSSTSELVSGRGRAPSRRRTWTSSPTSRRLRRTRSMTLLPGTRWKPSGSG